MNCCWIILLLLFCGQNGNVFCGGRNCGCEESHRPTKPSCGKPDPDPCPCEDARDSRFEPRFESRPYNGNGSTCGCEEDNH